MCFALFSHTECVVVLTCHEHESHDAPAVPVTMRNAAVMSCHVKNEIRKVLTKTQLPYFQKSKEQESL